MCNKSLGRDWSLRISDAGKSFSEIVIFHFIFEIAMG